MNFTAKDVADLRAKTGCGMMDCKKALTEAEGDVEKATEILREKGLAASVKKASRIAAEGVAYAMVSECGKVGVVIEVNAETDFVAKNAQFTETDALIMGKLYRRSNNWKFAAIGDAYRDNNDLRKTIKRIIENYSK